MIRRYYRVLLLLFLGLRLGLLHHLARKDGLSSWQRYLWLRLDRLFCRRRQKVWDDLPQRLWRLGPGFVKIGQILASRPDLIGDALCQRLTSLHDNLPALSPRQFQDMISDLSSGTGQENPFRCVHSHPLASGSVAVVYAAIDTNGHHVVIKRLRPSIRRQLLFDLSVIQTCCRIGQRWLPVMRRLGLNDVLASLTPLILKETDLRIEAANLARFHLTHQNDPTSTAPLVDWQNSTAHTLVMTRLDGVRIDAITRLRQIGHCPQTLANQLAALFFKDIFIHGCFHADPHPGNIHVAPDGRMILFDFGVIGWLDAADRRQILAIMAAIMGRRIDALIALHRKAGLIPNDLSPADLKALTAAIDAALAQPHLTSRVKALTLAMEQFDIQFTPAWPMLHKTILTLEGICHQLDPDTDIFSLFSAEMTRLLGSALPFFPLFVEMDHWSDEIMVEMLRDLGKNEYLSA